MTILKPGPPLFFYLIVIALWLTCQVMLQSEKAFSRQMFNAVLECRQEQINKIGEESSLIGRHK